MSDALAPDLGPSEEPAEPGGGPLPVGGDGLVNPAALAAALDEDTVLVSVMAANNETGALQRRVPLPGHGR